MQVSVLNKENETKPLTVAEYLSRFVPEEETGGFLRWLNLVKGVDYKNMRLAGEKAINELIDSYNKNLNQLQEDHEETKELINTLCEKYCIPSPLTEPSPEEPITQEEPLKFLEDSVAEFLEELSLTGHKAPDPDQHKMLFTRAPAVCVQAGAGAGKSTTLASRVAFLHLKARIPLHKITVTTFTRESRREFIEKVTSLINDITGENRVDIPVGKSLVKTFHGLAYAVHTRFGDSSKKIIYKDKTPKFENENGEVIDIDNLDALSEEERRGINYDDSIPPLSKIQNDVYKSLYSCNETHGKEFRKLIDELYLDSFKNADSRKPSDDPDHYFYSAQCEDQLSDLVLNDWITENRNLFDRRFKKYLVPERQKVEVKGVELNYHFELPRLKAKVYVSKSASHYYRDKRYFNFAGTKNKLAKHMADRRWFVFYKSSSTYIHIEKASDLIRLIDREESLDVSSFEETVSPPLFTYCCIGDKGSKEPTAKKFKHIYQRFYEISCFIYSLGHSIRSCSREDLKDWFGEVPGDDLKYFQAAILYIEALEQELDSQGYITFEQIFHQFSDASHKQLNSPDLVDSLSWCEHLLIDEFQDISPNIINFFNNIKSIYFREKRKGTFMCVGDEQQSIYGWRGSSYRYIRNPDKYFPVNGEFVKIPLNNNYRSTQKVVDIGKHGLKKLGKVPDFQAAGKLRNATDSEFTVTKSNDKHQNGINYDSLLQRLTEVIDSEANKNKVVYVLYKNHAYAKGTGHKQWDEAFYNWKKNGKSKPLTIHTSKGLESETIFILGDINTEFWNPLKNAIYAWCGIGGTYDGALKHQAICLSYVAVTRSMKNIHWYFSKENGETLGNHYVSLADKIFN